MLGWAGLAWAGWGRGNAPHAPHILPTSRACSSRRRPRVHHHHCCPGGRLGGSSPGGGRSSVRVRSHRCSSCRSEYPVIMSQYMSWASSPAVQSLVPPCHASSSMPGGRAGRAGGLGCVGQGGCWPRQYFWQAGTQVEPARQGLGHTTLCQGMRRNPSAWHCTRLTPPTSPCTIRRVLAPLLPSLAQPVPCAPHTHQPRPALACSPALF